MFNITVVVFQSKVSYKTSAACVKTLLTWWGGRAGHRWSILASVAELCLPSLAHSDMDHQTSPSLSAYTKNVNLVYVYNYYFKTYSYIFFLIQLQNEISSWTFFNKLLFGVHMQYCAKNFTYNKKHGQRNLYFLFITCTCNWVYNLKFKSG